MDSYFSLPRLQQLPFQRRLSRLYNDTKRSSDFVKEPLQNAEDPDIKALHRKLRIQKDRLVSWGLEWSDPTQSEVLIDSSLSRAGLSEVVGSIMSTIKDTLAEVEPLWLSSKQMVATAAAAGAGVGVGVMSVSASALDKAVEAHGGSGKSIAAAAAAAAVAAADREQDRDRKLPIVDWDKARFADLIHDLTVSIDTLYDLSRTRSSAATGGTDGGSVFSEKMAMAAASTASTATATAAATATATLPGSWPSATLPFTSRQQNISPAIQPNTYHRGYGPSSRILVPQQIDSTTLTIIESSTRPSADVAAQSQSQSRDVVFMNKQAYADLVARPAGQSYAPLLLEYAYFDPVYASTGNLPSLGRLDKLSAGLGLGLLQGERDGGQRLLDAWSGTPRLLGYFEDMDHARLGLVYQFPAGFHAIASSESESQSPATLRACLYSLGDLLSSPGFEPKLEAKFRLASNLANAVFEMHAKGIAHGNLADASILFGRVACPDAHVSSADVSQVDMRKPVIASFDLFPDTPGGPPDGPYPTHSDRTRRSARLHQHPLNFSAFAPGAPPLVDADPRVFDLYSLAMLLLSIGMWTRLENLVPHRDSAMVSEAVLEQLATQCGTLYMKAVQTCWNAMETVVSAGKAAGESHLARLQVRASSYLEACCVLDDVNKLEDRLRNDLGGDDTFEVEEEEKRKVPPAVLAHAHTAPLPSRPKPGLLSSAASLEPPPLPPLAPLDPLPPLPQPQPLPPRTRRLLSMPAAARDTKPPPLPPKTAPLSSSTMPAKDVPEKSSEPKEKEKTRMRLYPQVALPADVVEKWHSYLMPQVNYALRHFYRSHPESVEISLESVGDSPRNTRPTVVVVCTSVHKVRGILKRKMGNVFEGGGGSMVAGNGSGNGNGIGLKVCTGRVMRSRRQPGYATGRGQDETVAPANSQFQQKPENGASIGAWIGDRHLPPVSFGGLVLVDDKPFGMTVHHMLDDPEAGAQHDDSQGVARSSGVAAHFSLSEEREGEKEEEEDDDDDTEARQQLEQSLLDWYTERQAEASAGNSGSDDDEDYACEFSDTSSVSESDNTSEWSVEGGGEGEEEDDNKSGDMPGVAPGYGEGYIVTQPALDDVDGNFYPDAATQDEDHLDSCGLGDVYASSGVRRRVDERGLVHEIDWALFAFKAERQPQVNLIPHVPLHRSETNKQKRSLRPTAVAPASALPGLEVQCMARTSGLQTGRILPTITTVKIYGRTSPSHTYQISASVGGLVDTFKPPPIGIPGDSGAWIIEREHGRLCGHVLAWSARKRVAYLCPMDVLLLDIAETLEAGDVRLPGGEAVVKIMDSGRLAVQGGEERPRLAMQSTQSTQSTSSLTLHESWESDGADTGKDEKDGKKRWQTSKMLELVGSMGKVGLGRGGNVQAPC